jgi:hypothetical protein
MANAEPMIVWGRVNLHKTKGKGGLDVSSFSATAGMTLVDVNFSTDDERRQEAM